MAGSCWKVAARLAPDKAHWHQRWRQNKLQILIISSGSMNATVLMTSTHDMVLYSSEACWQQAFKYPLRPSDSKL